MEGGREMDGGREGWREMEGEEIDDGEGWF